MPKERFELQLAFPKRSSTTVVVAEPTREAILREATNKFQLKKKEAAQAALFFFGSMGDPVALSDDGPICGGVVVVTAGETPLPRPSKRVLKHVHGLQWVPAGRGHLGVARGCPDSVVLGALHEQRGLSGVITLLRIGERNSAMDHIRETCQRLGMTFVGAPLNGWHDLVQCRLSPTDRESLETLKEIRQCLSQSEGDDRFIVHCSACLHRTGIYFYVLLRLLGDTPDAALSKMEVSRQRTREEFEKYNFQPWAEQILEELEPGLGDQDLLTVAREGRHDTVSDQDEEQEEED